MCEESVKFRHYIGLTYGRYLQFRFLKAPLKKLSHGTMVEITIFDGKTHQIIIIMTGPFSIAMLNYQGVSMKNED